MELCRRQHPSGVFGPGTDQEQGLWTAEARGREGSSGQDLQNGGSCREVRWGRQVSRVCSAGSGTTKKTRAPHVMASLWSRILTSPVGPQEEGGPAGRVQDTLVWGEGQACRPTLRGHSSVCS